MPDPASLDPAPHRRLARIEAVFSRLGLLHILSEDIEWLLQTLRARLGDPEPQAPAWFTPVQQQLAEIQRTLQMTDKNLDQIASDWPQLKALISETLSKVSDLQSQLQSATSSGDDGRAAQIHTDMQAAISQLQGIVASAQPTTGAAGTGTDTAATGSTGATGAAPAPGTDPTSAQAATSGTTGGGVGGSSTSGSTTGAVTA